MIPATTIKTLWPTPYELVDMEVDAVVVLLEAEWLGKRTEALLLATWEVMATVGMTALLVVLNLKI